MKIEIKQTFEDYLEKCKRLLTIIMAKESEITTGPSTRTGTKPTGLSWINSENVIDSINYSIYYLSRGC
jgi:hypothetical protein